jgi:hypothetical protein
MTLATCQQLQSCLLCSFELYTSFVNFILSFLMNDRSPNWHGNSDASQSKFTVHVIFMSCYGNLTLLCVSNWVSLDNVPKILGTHDALNFLFRLCYLRQCWYNTGHSSAKSYVHKQISHVKEHVYIKSGRHVTRCPPEPANCFLKCFKVIHSMNFYQFVTYLPIKCTFLN